MRTTSFRIQNLPLLVARPALQIRFAGEGERGMEEGKGHKMERKTTRVKIVLAFGSLLLSSAAGELLTGRGKSQTGFTHPAVEMLGSPAPVPTCRRRVSAPRGPPSSTAAAASRIYGHRGLAERRCVPGVRCNAPANDEPFPPAVAPSAPMCMPSPEPRIIHSRVTMLRASRNLHGSTNRHAM